MRVRVQAPIRPTEDGAKVALACQTLIAGDVEVDGEQVIVTTSDLDMLRRRIWELRIIDTMRGALLAGAHGRRLDVVLSKQAAAAGKVSVPIGAALGDIRLSVDLEDGDPHADAEALCWWLCPETKDGQIVGPTD